MLEIIVAVLIAAFVTLIATAYFFENKIQKSEARLRNKIIVDKNEHTLSIKSIEDAAYKKGYVDGGLDAKKQFARMFHNYPQS